MIIIFIVCWIITLIYAIRLMSQGWTAGRGFSYTEGKRTITKVQHPELSEVKPGDELMVVRFGDEEKRDPLHQELKNRIEELEDEDDDDGDVIISRR